MISPYVARHDRIGDMQAVLFDMDGTLVDSEKLWDISLAALYKELGGTLTPEVRTSMVGGSAEDTIRTVYTDLGLELDPLAMAESVRWLHDYTAQLFDGGLPWCDGARELLEALAAEGTPMALVTNTQRALTDRALNSIGHHYFSATVCGDEVPQWQTRTRRLSAGGGVAGAAARRVPGHRGFRHRHGRRGGRRMPGVGGTQRRSGASWSTAQAHFVAGRCRCGGSATGIRRTQF